MSPNDAFRVIDSKAVFEDLNLSTEIQFSTDVAQMSTHSAYLYWVVSSNKKNGGISRILTLVLWCERSNTPEFQGKHYNLVSLTNFFQMLYSRLILCKSKLSATFSQAFWTASLILKPFTISLYKTGKPYNFSASISSCCKHNVAIFIN